MRIRNGLVFYEGKFQKKDIVVQDGRFAEITDSKTLTGAEEDSFDKSGWLDARGCYVLPGLVDVHSHGRSGEDFSFVTEETLRKLCCSYADCGVTTVLGTTMTNDPAKIEASMESIGAYSSKAQPGARLAGVHMEGPFLGKDKKGAHDEAYLTAPDEVWFDKLQKLCGNRVRLISLDPCLSGAMEFIQKCKEQNLRISLGHTSCDYETAVKAAEAGADHVTHLFNAMNPLHHRNPGLIGAAMDTGMYTELICDGIHLHPSVIRMMFAMHPEQMLLISDSMQAAGLSDGEYELGGLKVFVKEKKATLSDGTIAGSTTNVYEAMVNAIRFGVPAEQAVASASYFPAKSVGIENEAGSIAKGHPADFLLVDEAWNLKAVYIQGKPYLKG